MFPLKLAPVFFIKCPESPGVFMNRFCSCPFPVLAAVCCLTVLFLGGCSNKEGVIISDPSPEFISPPCPDLNGSVAVVVRPSSELASGYENVPAELNRFLHVRISMDVTRFRKRKREQISLIPPDRLLDVYGKIDSKTDFLEVGKALGADQVIAVELLRLEHIAGADSWQGRANVDVRLLDVKTGSVLYHPEPFPECVYPRKDPIPAADRSEADFLKEYILRLGKHIGRHFVPNDPGEMLFGKMENRGRAGVFQEFYVGKC